MFNGWGNKKRGRDRDRDRDREKGREGAREWSEDRILNAMYLACAVDHRFGLNLKRRTDVGGCSNRKSLISVSTLSRRRVASRKQPSLCRCRQQKRLRFQRAMGKAGDAARQGSVEDEQAQNRLAIYDIDPLLNDFQGKSQTEGEREREREERVCLFVFVCVCVFKAKQLGLDYSHADYQEVRSYFYLINLSWELFFSP